MKARLQRDVSELLMPSRERALALNKAYRSLVERQTFQQGRDIVLDGARNVHRSVEAGQKTSIQESVAPPWSAAVARRSAQSVSRFTFAVTRQLPKLRRRVVRAAHTAAEAHSSAPVHWRSLIMRTRHSYSSLAVILVRIACLAASRARRLRERGRCHGR